MSWQKAMTILGLLLLGACTQEARSGFPPLRPVEPQELEFAALDAGFQRTFERSLTEAPFANGDLAVIAAVGREVASYRLVPCQGGQAICGGGANGPAGQLVRTPDWFVVRGLYGQTFWLSYGGDGYLERGGQLIPLVWEARATGTGSGDAPSLETPYRHD
jgi:hypothetical protein